MVVKHSKCPLNTPTFFIQGPPKLTKIGIFCMKINHLATLQFQSRLVSAENNFLLHFSPGTEASKKIKKIKSSTLKKTFTGRKNFSFHSICEKNAKTIKLA
jgi:hypothetical protein